MQKATNRNPMVVHARQRPAFVQQSKKRTLPRKLKHRQKEFVS